MKSLNPLGCKSGFLFLFPFSKCLGRKDHNSFIFASLETNLLIDLDMERQSTSVSDSKCQKIWRDMDDWRRKGREECVGKSLDKGMSHREPMCWSSGLWHGIILNLENISTPRLLGEEAEEWRKGMYWFRFCHSDSPVPQRNPRHLELNSVFWG